MFPLPRKYTFGSIFDRGSQYGRNIKNAPLVEAERIEANQDYVIVKVSL